MREGKRAVVVGASSGMGRELARILAAAGYAVTVMARRVHLLEELRGETNGAMFVQRIDVSDADGARDALTHAIDKMGGLDLLVISAGAGELNPGLEWSVEEMAIRTNVTGFAAVASVAFRHFEEVGSGHLVGISSIAALRGGRESPAYNASKAFESNYMEGLRQKAMNLRLPITITDVRPGFVDTAMAKGQTIFWAAPADRAARQIFNAVRRKRSVVYVTRRWRLIAWLIRMIPAMLYERF